MYNEFYGFKENPFSPTVDPRYFYSNKVFGEAFKYLNYIVENRQGFLELTGSVGCGKTMLARVWMQQLPEHIKAVYFPHPELSEFDFLEEVGQKLGLANRGNTYSEFVRYLNQYLLEMYEKGERLVFVFDEAHKLSADMLETIRLCSNIETEKEKLLQVVLVGSNDLDLKLQQSHLRQLDQRISLRFQLDPLKKKELRPYIDLHLRTAGLEGKLIFTGSAINRIYNFSKGIPREINKVCDKVLLMGYFFRTRKITAKLVEAAIKNTQGRWRHTPSLFFLSLSNTAVWVILLLLGAAVLLSWRFQERIIGWTSKINPTLRIIKVSLLHRLHLPPEKPVDNPAENKKQEDKLPQAEQEAALRKK